MKVYVSELPKDCIGCPFCQDIEVNAGMDRLLFCKANKGKAIKNIEKSFNKCIVKKEFQSLTDYTKQVRKEVCKEITEELLDISHPYWKTFLKNGVQYMTSNDLYEFLKEIDNKLQGADDDK